MDVNVIYVLVPLLGSLGAVMVIERYIGDRDRAHSDAEPQSRHGKLHTKFFGYH
ncbi:hypothetical protein [Rhodococcus sp. NPDC058521]|uniref:hypothetical protein n=1 Tax=Rhodococcus sp. NPDC058521 TaxID=3346536 RepID=UPI003656F8C6